MTEFARGDQIGVYFRAPQVEEDRLETPALALRRDLRLSGARMIIFLVAFAVGVPVLFKFDYPVKFNIDLWVDFGITFGAAGGVVYGFSGTSARYCLSVLTLWMRRRTPLMLIQFLDYAHQVGLIRRVGPVYQFRHLNYQRYLVEQGAAASGWTRVDRSLASAAGETEVGGTIRSGPY
jgi:hypothetical protein